ncbi:hypothetical protein HUJ04_005569 [Dendroctonus ponderosae]|nr:hypothetical protein HUJ04_005569 [Dendroctonus ponderosae]
MDSTKKFDNPSPEESASCWVLPFFKLGYQKDLQVKDIYNTTKGDLSQPLGDILERNWNEEVLRAQKSGKRPSLKRAIWKTIGKSYMFIGFLIFLNTFLIKMTQPIVLGRYIKYFEKSSTRDATMGWSLGSGVILLAFLNMVAMHYTIVNCSRVGMRVRIACCSLMYRKLLRLNHISSGKTAAGQLVNLLSNDVVRFDFALAFLHYIWIMPLQGIAGLIVMYSYIQTAAFPTMLVMTIQAVLGQGYLSRLQGKFRGKIATLTDQRVKLMNEITSGIQVIKMYAWEKPFEKIVEFSRRKEVNMIARNSYIRGFSSALNIFVERATLYIAVISYVLLGNRITVVKVCALQRDFEELPFGDKTQVGEKGALLSGGQRARVALARAVYREADAYLLDDPLSAVDAHVAKHLFEQCIQQYLAGKTRILVTHQVQFLKGADMIVVMNNGMVAQEFDTLQDQHTSTWCLLLQTSEALGFYLDVISTVFLGLVTFQFLIFQSEDTVSGNVGLVIAQSLILTGMLQFGIRQSAEVSSNMTSVERILQYTKLEEEGPWDPLPADRPPTDWPREGRVTFKHAYLRYTPDGPPSIRDLDVEIQPGEKIGIVGRTGAGKSSLVATLFRLAPIEGAVEIDGLNTGKVGLRALRSSISIIPQVPTLFSASLRYNLDPFEKCADDELWKAVERVELKQSGVALDTAVSESGANFSAGQRQLICLARAIVRNNKILVMDEATANVDQHTDSLIQTTIRQAFKDCTVITIAHRINTIIDCDRVLVMDHGQAVEFAAPHELLEQKNGHFAQMVEQTGPTMSSKLRKQAKDSYNQKRAVENQKSE